MNGQISITVKNASIFYRFYTFLWFINIFRKMSVDAYIDSPNAKPQRLKARKEPYLIDLAPGAHMIVFADPTAGEKRLNRYLSGAFAGFSLGLVGGMQSAFDLGSSMGDAFAGNRAQDNTAQFFLQEGEVVKLQVQPKMNGSVNIQYL